LFERSRFQFPFFYRLMCQPIKRDRAWFTRKWFKPIIPTINRNTRTLFQFSFRCTIYSGIRSMYKSPLKFVQSQKWRLFNHPFECWNQNKKFITICWMVVISIETQQQKSYISMIFRTQNYVSDIWIELEFQLLVTAKEEKKLVWKWIEFEISREELQWKNWNLILTRCLENWSGWEGRAQQRVWSSIVTSVWGSRMDIISAPKTLCSQQMQFFFFFSFCSFSCFFKNIYIYIFKFLTQLLFCFLS